MKKTLLFSWLLCLLCITARAQSVLQAVSNQGETYSWIAANGRCSLGDPRYLDDGTVRYRYLELRCGIGESSEFESLLIMYDNDSEEGINDVYEAQPGSTFDVSKFLIIASYVPSWSEDVMIGTNPKSGKVVVAGRKEVNGNTILSLTIQDLQLESFDKSRMYTVNGTVDYTLPNGTVGIRPAAIVKGQHFPAGMTWEEAVVNPDMNVDYSSSKFAKHLFEVSTDTLICGVTYKKVMKDNNPADMYIRESNEKVWLLTNDYPSEILLYNFDWDNGQDVVTEYLKELENGEYELKKDTMKADDYQTVSVDGQTLQYHRESFYRSTIRRIGNVAELSRNSSLLGYKESMIPLPGLDYIKVLWIRKNNNMFFQSEKVSDWTVEVPLMNGDNINTACQIHSSAEVKDVFYDLQGHRLAAPPKKGVYIQDGKKILITKD